MRKYGPVGLLAILAILLIVGGISGRLGDYLAALLAPQALVRQ